MKTPRPLVLTPYDAAWPGAFAAERARISAAFGGLPAEVEHVGSTSVPGLAAKPVLDIMVGRPPASDAAPYVAALVALGYEHRGAHGIPGRDYFVRGEPRSHQVHMVALGGGFWRRHLAFRDELRRSPATADAYAALKHRLAARFRDDRDAYLEGKTEFIEGVVARALDRGVDGGGQADEPSR
jgi:GrpB-like predicted nucleotidyltransferase (UPF0157 family)